MYCRAICIVQAANERGVVGHKDDEINNGVYHAQQHCSMANHVEWEQDDTNEDRKEGKDPKLHTTGAASSKEELVFEASFDNGENGVHELAATMVSALNETCRGVAVLLRKSAKEKYGKWRQ